MDFKLIKQFTGLNQINPSQPRRVTAKLADGGQQPNLQIRNPQQFKQAQQSVRQTLGSQSGTGTNQVQQLAQLMGENSGGAPSSLPQTSSSLQGLKKLGAALLGKMEQANPKTQSLAQLNQSENKIVKIPLESLEPSLKGTLELDLDAMAKDIVAKYMQDSGLNGVSTQLLKEANIQSGGKIEIDLQKIDPQLKGKAEIDLDAMAKNILKTPEPTSPSPTPVIQRVRSLSQPLQSPQSIRSQPLSTPLSTAQIQSPNKTGPTVNITDQQAEKAGESFRNKLQERLKKAPPQSPVGQYHAASKLLNEYALYRQTGQGPLATDSQARELVEANLKFLEDKVKKLSADPSVQATFKAAREEALKATFGPQHATVAKHYANHLLSNNFTESLKNLSPDQQKSTLLKATLKLSALDPALANQTMKTLVLKQMEGELIQNLNLKGPVGDNAREALRATVQDALAKQMSDGYDHADKIAKMTDQMMDAFQKNPKLLLNKDGFTQALNEGIQALKNSKQIPAKQMAELQDSLKGLRAPNAVGSLLSKAALLNGAYLLSGGTANTEQFLKGLGNVTSGVAGLENLGKLLNLSSDSALMGKLTKLKALGPLGDALGVAADIAGAINEGKNEDGVGQALKVLSAATGTAGAIAGVAVLAGATGPLAPLVVGGAAIVGIGLSVADYFFAESDKTGEVRQALRNTGLSQAQDKIKVKYDQAAGYLYDDHQQMLKDFRNLQSPADKVRYINQLLDNKDVWISKGRANVARQMLESLSGKELESLIQNGLHTAMLGRKIGFDSQASAGIARKLMELNTPVGNQALQQFLSGLNLGQHSQTLQELLNQPDLGETMLGKLNSESIKDLALKAPDGKTAVKILEHSTWKQFNQIIQGSGSEMFLHGIKTKLVNTPDSHLIGELAAWGRENGAEPATRQKLENWFSDFQKDAAQPQNYAPPLNSFVKSLSLNDLRQLDDRLKQRLKLSVEVMPGHYQDPEVTKKLKQAGII